MAYDANVKRELLATQNVHAFVTVICACTGTHS